MPVAPLGSFSTPVVTLSNMFVQSLTFGTDILESNGIDTGATPYDPDNPAHEDLVRERINYYADEAGDDDLAASKLPKPFIVITSRPEFRRSSQSNKTIFVASGHMVVIFCRQSDNVTIMNDSFISFMNFAGQVIGEVAERAGCGLDDVPLTGMEVLVDAQRTKMEERDQDDDTDDRIYDYWEMGIKWTYGF